MFRRCFAIVAIATAMLLTMTTPLAEATQVPQTESTVDEPRSTSPVKAFGPYRVNVIAVAQPAKKITATITPVGPQWTPDNRYQIRAGDTLSALVKFLGFSVSEIARTSGIGNPNVLVPGQWLYKPGTRAIPVPRPSTPSVPQNVSAVGSGAAQAAIQFALAQQGDPYVWGGNGPNVWDCSGLVHAAYANAGVRISRSTKTLINEGTPVSRASLAPGDLVFPDDGHVGIYLGNGQMVHAPQSGDVVKVSSLYAFWAARRVA